MSVPRTPRPRNDAGSNPAGADPPDDRAAARDKGELRKASGMRLAALRMRPLILRHKILTLDTLSASPTRTTSSDDTAADLHTERLYGGKWVGSVHQDLARKGLIVHVGYRPSDRTSRHRTPIAVWQAAVSDDALRAARDRFAAQLADLEHQMPADNLFAAVADREGA
jgi:hypothetical protein